MQSPLPLTREIVLIGGGHCHALVLRKWGMNPLPGARLTLINPDPMAPYTGMLPGFVAGHYTRADLDIDLVRLARFAGARLILGRAVAIDRKTRRIRISGHPDIAYDIASIDIGITSDLPDLPGFCDHAVPAKPLGDFAANWERLLANSPKPLAVSVIGGGVGGVELALAAAHRLGDGGTVTIVEKNQILADLPENTASRLREELARYGVDVREQVTVSEVEKDAVLLESGERLPSNFCIGVAGARPQAWLQETNLTLHKGFVTVDDHLRSDNDPTIYAVGDCAHLSFANRPKAGVYAVREAPVLYHNLRADLTGAAPLHFRPQKDYLKLISTGRKSAVGEKFGMRFRGRWLWWIKDRIDQAFMRKLAELPTMPRPVLPEAVAAGVREAVEGGQPLCGGCGSKVGPGDLREALCDIPAPSREDVLSGPGDDAAILKSGDGAQVITADHLRAFVEDPYLMARITAVHALGDIRAMGAEPQVALSSLILPRMSDPMQTNMLREITTGAREVFAEAGADLVGGHTSVGAELTIGFTLTGLARDPVTHEGAQVGDRLVVTKPIGAGVLLAAEMQAQANGSDIAKLYSTLADPQTALCRLLAKHAHAMTDVTGFGLAGHLDRLCIASRVGAQVHLEKLPLHSGALGLSATGHRSSIYSANRTVLPNVPDSTPLQKLLFDPQTAGGLLAALPPNVNFDGVFEIGEITEGSGITLL
jgi:selenide,water dikinase